MDVVRRIKTRVRLLAGFVLALGVLTITGGATTAQGTTGPYWFDNISQCKDRCVSMDFPNCRCFKLEPIIIEVPKK